MSIASTRTSSGNINAVPVLISVILLLAVSPAFSTSEEVRAILDRLDATETKPVQPTGPKPAPIPSSSAASASPKPKTTAQTGRSTASPAGIARSVKVYGTKDKLPRKIAGQLLAGEFFVLGEYIDGGSVLYAVEDEGKTFFRQYVVVNRTSGLTSGNYHDVGRRPRVTFPRQQPLVFVEKLFPGLYAVRAP